MTNGTVPPPAPCLSLAKSLKIAPQLTASTSGKASTTAAAVVAEIVVNQTKYTNI